MKRFLIRLKTRNCFLMQHLNFLHSRIPTKVALTYLNWTYFIPVYLPGHWPKWVCPINAAERLLKRYLSWLFEKKFDCLTSSPNSSQGRYVMTRLNPANIELSGRWTGPPNIVELLPSGGGPTKLKFTFAEFWRTPWPSLTGLTLRQINVPIWPVSSPITCLWKRFIELDSLHTIFSRLYQLVTCCCQFQIIF